MERISYLFLGVKNLSLCVTGLLQLFAVEIFVIQALWQFYTTDIQLCFCGDSVDLVDSSKRATIQMEWTWYTTK